MKLHRAFIAAALLLAACGGKKEKNPPPDPGSQAAKPPDGSGSGSGSAPTGPGSQMTNPTDVPLTGEALAKHYVKCVEWRSAGKLKEYKDGCLDGEVTVHEMDYGEFKGADEAVAYFEALRTAFPDMKDQPQIVL